MTPRKRKATLQDDDPPPKRTPKGRSAKKQDDPVWATQNSNSHLVDQDLHAKYSDPATYENWTQEDWEEIRDCLPENAPYNDDGYSVPMHFFKHDPDWRRLVREFQEDLGAGRYEPQWLKQAALAMEERAAGKFDKFKEDQFEAFWGQKQILHHDVRAGESAKIKLSQLVEAGLIKVGDDLSYRRTFRSKAGVPLMIEKDLKVITINGTTMTVSIPPGQFKYPHFRNQPAALMIGPTDTSPMKTEASQRNHATEKTVGDFVVNESSSTSRGVTTGTETSYDSRKVASEESEQQTSVDNSHASKVATPERSSSNGTSPASQAKPDDFQNAAGSGVVGISQQEERNNEGTEILDSSEAILNFESRIQKDPVLRDKPLSATEGGPGEDNLDDDATVDEVAACGHNSALVSNDQASDIDSATGCFLYEVWKPNGLENRIIEIDGRMDPKDAPIASSWRYIRVQRSNQDLGSLFDLREELYVWNSSTIVKMPKKGRGKSDYQGVEKSKDKTETPREKAKVLTKEGVSEGTPPFNRRPERSRTTKGKRKTIFDNDEFVKDSEDDESIAERESDGEFTFKAPPKTEKNQKSKPRGRPKRLTAQNQGSNVRTESVADDDPRGDSNESDGGEGELSNDERKKRKHKSRHTVWCPYCKTGFTKAFNMKIHIGKSCKKVPTE